MAQSKHEIYAHTRLKFYSTNCNDEALMKECTLNDVGHYCENINNNSWQTPTQASQLSA